MNKLAERDGKPYMAVDGGADFDQPIHRTFYYPINGRFTDTNRCLVGNEIRSHGEGRYSLQVGDNWQPLELANGKDTQWAFSDAVPIPTPGRKGKTWHWVWNWGQWEKRY